MKLVIAALVILVLALVVLAPAVLLIVAAIRYKRNVEDASGWIIVIAGVLFSTLVLDILAPLLFPFLPREPEKLAAASMFLVSARVAVTYVAVLLLGIGLWIRSGKMRAAEGRGRPIPQLQGQGGE